MRVSLLLLGLLLCNEGIRNQEVSNSFALFARFSVTWGFEIEDEREFTYDEGEKTGPEHCRDLYEERSTYGKGQQQCPIDVVKQRAKIYPVLGQLRWIYLPANATLLNKGLLLMHFNPYTILPGE